MTDDEWAIRQLCDDGACTGVIGSDGLCRGCGRPAPFWGDERRRGMQRAADEPSSADDAERGDAGGDDAGEFTERTLCPDGGCVGVIGADGACGVCGRRAVVAVVAPRVALARAGADQRDDASDDDDRRLCPDGSCIGLLDADGVCKACGRSDVGN